ncbi:MAG: polyphosphate kinase 1 [Gammaproteobacteria bacterium]|nr:polyphosphate kinase 1 [Gammaproteobacteria bacterium]
MATPAAAEQAVNLASADLYINRELAQLEFNRRVLEQAKREDVPLLERLRFLCIAGSILDEFFEIRVSGLKQQEEVGATQRGPDNLSPSEQLRRIALVAHELVDEQYRILNDVLFPLLDAQGIRFLKRSQWNAGQEAWLRDFYHLELEPILTPIGLDPAHPFPRIMNKNLTFIVTLEGKDAFGRNSGMAVVQAPRTLPRVVRLPEEQAESPHDFVFLSSIIHAHVDELFPGMNAVGCYQFRVTRNSDLYVDEEEVDDLLVAVEGELSSRRFGDAVRLELADDCPGHVGKFLTDEFSLSEEDVYYCNGPVNLMRINAIPDLVDRPDLKYPGFTPGIPARIRTAPDIFAAIRSGDILLHHPFHSFVPVLDFLRSAAEDPNVLSIRQTLYRTGTDSAAVKVLLDAARRGKEVLVVIELRARFDEAANIELANHLQEAGAQVVYGIVGHKTHAKMILVIRREAGELRRYAHLGTGNYHTRTARTYTDFGLLTSEPDLAADVQRMFHQLTTMGRSGQLNKLVQSPFTLHETILGLIDAEIENSGSGRPAGITAKMNQLIDPEVIQALYRASQAGVRVQLVVRGICALKPGIEGVSENITVRSIVGRFLEHTRIFLFENGGEPRIYLSSADWMGRNFFSRVEACFPVEDPESRQAVIQQGLEPYLADNAQAWELQPDGGYERAPGGEERNCAQEKLLDRLTR